MGGFSNSEVNASVRGYILRSLVKGYHFSLAVKTLSNKMMSCGLIDTPDISNQLYYLEQCNLIQFSNKSDAWIKELVLKNDGIFAKVEWTKKARDYLQNREYRYLSPVVLVRKKDHKASQLHSVALTNTPAINGMMPIVNSVKPPLQADTQLDDIQKKICRI